MARRHVQSNRVSTRLAIRLIPVLVLCLAVFVTYMFVGRICVTYLIYDIHRPAAAAPIIALYSLLFILTLAAYLRTIIAVIRDPGLVPLVNDDATTTTMLSEKQPRRSHRQEEADLDDVEAHPYPTTTTTTTTPMVPDASPDSPGLEAFYSKNVFVCEADGRPRWCSGCRQWKPDRAHHSSELGRCVRKMDHLCPWVGGMVSETSFNFFTQFAFYCSLCHALVLAVSAYVVSRQVTDRVSSTPDAWAVAATAVSALICLFSGGMALTSLRYILTNMTNIDMFSRNRISYLAVHVPLLLPPSTLYSTIVYPLQYQHQHQQQPSLVAWSSSSCPPAAAADDNDDSRDQRALRKFAILRLESRENPWHLGLWGNWTAVMGHAPLQWLLPLAHSPCCRHDSMESDYPTGKLVDEVKKRYFISSLGE